MTIAVASCLTYLALVGAGSLFVPTLSWLRGLWPAVFSLVVCGSAALLAYASPHNPPRLEIWWAAIAALGASTWTGSQVVGVLLERTLKIPLLSGHDELPASAWIGMVERLGFTVAMMLGFPEVAAILIGVKALGQYGTVTPGNNSSAAARVVGTLASVTWALAVYAAFAALAR